MSQNPVIGELQLAAWQKLARTWPVYLDEQEHFRCKECNVSIWRLSDDNGQGYIYTPGELLALKVAHIRQCHGDLEADVYERAGLEHERNISVVKKASTVFRWAYHHMHDHGRASSGH